MPDYRDFDRPRGLTKSDRAFIAGNRDSYTEDSKRQKWYRIRRRLRSSLVDFSLLLEELEPERVVEIFSTHGQGSADGVEAGYIDEAMVDALAFFIASFYDEAEVGGNTIGADVNVRTFLEAGLRYGLEARGLALHDFDLTYSTSPLDLDKLLLRFFNGEELTLEEFETIQREASIVDLRQYASVRHMAATRDDMQAKHDGEVFIESDEIVGPWAEDNCDDTDDH